MPLNKPNPTINLQSTFLGFTDSLTLLQKSKVSSTLDTQIKHNNVIMPKKQFIYLKLNEGYIPIIEEDVSYYSRKLGDYTKPKSEYRLSNPEGSYYTITKTEYNFATYLIENDFLDVVKAKQYIDAEQIKLAQLAQIEFNRKQQEKLDKELLKQQKQEFDLWLSEQAENYSDNTKLDLAKTIFESEQCDYNELYLCKLLVTIDNIDITACKEKLKNSLYSHNKTSKKVFYHITGIKLPSTDKGTMEIIDGLTLSSYQGIIPYKKKQSKSNNNNDTQTETFYKLIRRHSSYHFESVTGSPITKHGLEMFITQDEYGDYQLSESKSGVLIIANVYTKKELMSKLKSLVDQYGIEYTKRLIQESIDKYGISPRYQDVI